MKLILTATAVFALLATSIAPSTQPVARAGTGVCPENFSPPNAADPSMVLTTPAEGATVTSPVTVSGLARVFEANVRITIYDANGAVLTDTFTTAAQAGPVLAPYSAAVPFSISTTQQGCRPRLGRVGPRRQPPQRRPARSYPLDRRHRPTLHRRRRPCL